MLSHLCVLLTWKVKKSHSLRLKGGKNLTNAGTGCVLVPSGFCMEWIEVSD